MALSRIGKVAPERFLLRRLQMNLFTKWVFWSIVNLQIGVSHMQPPQGG
jgi:hypothetical protein